MKRLKLVVSVVLSLMMVFSIFTAAPVVKTEAANPYIPMWEHMPDGEPRVFQDPDDPTGTKQRVYVFGSHDVKRDNYCGPDIAAWSAPINELNNWRNDGPIFTSYNESTNTWDRMFAPDIAEVRIKDPTNPKAKANGMVYTYYLYPHNISDDVLSFNGFRMSMVAKSDRPDGPFEVINWVDPTDRTLDTLGPIGFDPGAFIDYDEDDNILGAYVFWGFQTATAGELDLNTMYTLKPHTESKYNTQMYSTESFAALTASISSARAVYNKAGATQTEIDAVIQGVLNQIPNLERLYTPKPSPDALKAGIAIGKALISKYPGRYEAASVTVLSSMISAGETRINYSNRNSTQAQINTALTNILTAIDGLVEVSGYAENAKKEALYVVLNRAESLSNDRPIDYVIPSSSSTDNDTTYPYVHARAKEGRTAAQVKSAFSFFEASSIRKIGNKYVMIFSGQSGSEYGMGGSSSTLRYAYGDTPMGPWVDGGVLVDSRGPEVNQAGTAVAATNYASNTHGSIVEIPSTNPDGSVNPDGESQWYCFYHRPPRGSGNARQSTVAPVKVSWDEASVDDGGKVTITGFDPYAADKKWTAKDSTGREYTGAEVTSEGFNLCGLNPYEYYSAGIACYYVNNNPGSVINVLQDAYDVWDDHAPVTGLQNNYTLGYKYFDFEHYTKPENNTQFDLYLKPTTANAFTVNIMMDSPWEGVRGGTKIGEISVPANAKQVKTKFSVPVPAVDALGKKHAIYLKVSGDSGSLCDVLGLSFSKQETMLDDNFGSSSSSQNWILDGGAQLGASLTLSGNASASTGSGKNWRNYEVVSDVTLQSGDLGLRFMQSGSNYYALQMKADGSLALESVVNGAAPKALGSTAAGTFTAGTSARVGINTDGGLLSVRVNGALVLQVNNTDHDHGGVGFVSTGNASAAISRVWIHTPTEKEVLQPTVSIEVDGKALNFEGVLPTNYTVFNGIYDFENYEMYYPLAPTQKTAPVVTASCGDKDVKVSISQADGVPGVAVVRFNRDGRFKSYLISFGVGATITPAKSGRAFGAADKAAGDMVELGALKDLVTPEKWGGDWELWVNFASNPWLTSANYTTNTQAGLAIYDGNNPTQNLFRIFGRYQSTTQAGSGAAWIVNGTAGTANGSNFNAAHKLWYLRIVKRGNTMQAYAFTNSSTSTNWANIGAAQTFSADFFENAKIQAYATNTTAFDLTTSVTVLSDIMGVQSTAYNTYEQFTEDQIAVDAAAMAVGEGIAYKAGGPGANTLEKITKAVEAKLSATGKVTVKKATDSQVKKMNYDADLSTFKFDTCTVTAAPGNEEIGPYTLALKAGRASMVISPYPVVNATGKDFEKLVGLIETVSGKKDFLYTTASRSRLQEALTQAASLRENDDALSIANAYDQLSRALDKLELTSGNELNPGETYTVTVPYVNDTGKTISGTGLMAIYDVQDRLLSIVSAPFSAPAGDTVEVTLSAVLPEGSSKVTVYLLDNNFIPLVEAIGVID